MTVSGFMVSDHRECDGAFVSVEDAVASGDWTSARRRWDHFESAMRHHFELEEEVLFPRIEAATGERQGPTAVMRLDHRQMRELFQPMVDAIAACDAAGFRGMADAMMIMIQQHNMKEEQVLYPFADQVLPRPESVVEELRARGPSTEVP